MHKYWLLVLLTYLPMELSAAPTEISAVNVEET